MIFMEEDTGSTAGVASAARVESVVTPEDRMRACGDRAKIALNMLTQPKSEGDGLSSFSSALTLLVEAAMVAKQKGAFSTSQELNEAFDTAILEYTGATNTGELPEVEFKVPKVATATPQAAK